MNTRILSHAVMMLSCLVTAPLWGATLNVASDTITSVDFVEQDVPSSSDVTFMNTGLGASATGKNFLVMASFNGSNTASSPINNRQCRWQLLGDLY